MAPDGAQSQSVVEAVFDSDEVSFASDRYWSRATAQLCRDQYRTTARSQSGDNAYIQSTAYSLYAQAAESPRNGTELPTLPPPANANTGVPPAPAPAATAPPVPPAPEPPAALPAPAEAAAGTAPPAEAKPTTELEKEIKKVEADSKKKEEEKKKPVIPDLAKGILIASNDGDLTFKPGLRIQPRYMHDDGNGNNDFFIRRFRLKGSGSAYGLAKYGVELKIDNEGRFGVTPAARAENAWLDFPVIDDLAYFRAGLYDIPFSRDALTSDSKLLFMDRTLIKEQLTAVGFADNTFGIMLHGRPYGGQFEYAFNVSDNDQFERFGAAGTRESNELMPAGRLVWNVLDPMAPPDGYADYMESYLGKGERLELGVDAVHLGNAVDGLNTLDLTAWGVDVFANSGHYTFQAEYDQIIENIAGAADIISDGWYAQFGYLFNPCDPCAEFAVRYETLDPIIGNDRLDWVRVGFNFYIREHNLKVQTDYCFRSHNTLTAPLVGGLGFFDEDVFEVQLQLDF